MGRYGKTFDELYTRDQFRKAGEIYNTDIKFDFKFCPVVFSFPDGVIRISSSSGNETMIYLLVLYMQELWQKALDETLKAFPSFLKHEWRKEGYFQMLRFTDKSHNDGVGELWQNLESIADSGRIKVKESLETDENNNITVVCSSFSSFDAGRGNHNSEKMRSYVCSEKSVSYSWNDVKRYFIDLSEEEVSLLNCTKMAVYGKESQALFDACRKQDFDKIRTAVESGSDVNAFDECGNTPILCLLEGDEENPWESLSEKDEAHTDNIIRILDYLIENGADINLYSASSWSDVLTRVHFTGNLRLLKYFCQHNIRKDLNCFVCDFFDDRQWYILNAAYSYISDDIQIGDYDTPNVREQEKILREYGVTYYIEGWDIEKIRNYYDSLPNPYSEDPTERHKREDEPEYNAFQSLKEEEKKDFVKPEVFVGPFDEKEHTKLLNILASAWKSLDATELLKYIHPGFQYDSQWVYKSMYADEFSTYIMGKFEAVRKSGSKIDVEITDDPYFPGKMIHLGQDCRNSSVLRIKCTDNLIYKMDMCMF